MTAKPIVAATDGSEHSMQTVEWAPTHRTQEGQGVGASRRPAAHRVRRGDDAKDGGSRFIEDRP